jgi:hypothetical protein
LLSQFKHFHLSLVLVVLVVLLVLVLMVVWHPHRSKGNSPCLSCRRPHPQLHHCLILMPLSLVLVLVLLHRLAYHYCSHAPLALTLALDVPLALVFAPALPARYVLRASGIFIVVVTAPAAFAALAALADVAAAPSHHTSSMCENPVAALECRECPHLLLHAICLLALLKI